MCLGDHVVVREHLRRKAEELMAGNRLFETLDARRASLRPLLTSRVDPPGKYASLLAAMLHAQARFLETRVRADLELDPPRRPTFFQPALIRLGTLLCPAVLEDIVGPQDAQRAADLYVVAKDFHFSIK